MIRNCNAKGLSFHLREAAAAFVLLVMLLLFAGHAKADTTFGYILPDSSWRNYSYSEISSLPLQVVCYAKNEIYARNGRMFVSAELQNYFNQQSWYRAVYAPEQFSPDMLNTYETANVGLLDQRERELGTYTLDQSGYTYAAVYQYLNGISYYSDGYSVDPNSYIFYDSNMRYLSQQELSSLSAQELCYAKNEIYARRGRLFVSGELTNYFNQKNWYTGYIAPESFSDSVFNSYEASNAALLQQEEYARVSGGYQLDQPGYSYAGVGSYTAYSSYTPTSNDYIFWDSSMRYLSDQEVGALSLQQLCYARNEIYARRGYIFQSQELRDYFGSKSWYYPSIPSSSFSSSVFNTYEMANVELLKSYEYSISANGYQLY